jgi:hypothetical protein
MDLIEFLRARLAEDEVRANAAASALLYVGETEPEFDWTFGENEPEGFTVRTISEKRVARDVYDDTAMHIARHDPARVLREVEAKRRILAEHDHTTVHIWHDRSKDFEICTACGAGSDDQGCIPWPCDTVKLLALPYSDHPDYNEAWRP